MKSKLIYILKFLLPFLFWLSIWDLISLCINDSFILPGVLTTIKALVEIVLSKTFFSTVLTTLLRVLLGLGLGIVFGIAFAILSHHFTVANTIISPMISVIKSTPVASFIILLWATLSGYSIPIFIAFIMVVPLIWQNMLDGYSYIDKNLSEICDVFEFPYIKRIKYLILPSLSRYLVPAIITSVGLAWKAEIAAEIISLTDKSIGAYINFAKLDSEIDTVFAWTVIVIIFSLVLEKVTKSLLRRYKNEPQA